MMGIPEFRCQVDDNDSVNGAESVLQPHHLKRQT